MPENEIIAEIHRFREELAQRFDFDLHRLMAFYRERQVASEAAGVRFVSPAEQRVEEQGSLVREDVPEVL